MALSWNEIKQRAIQFSQDFANVTNENAEKQTFYNEFFNVFGISRRRVASFEEPVKLLGERRGFIDLFWKGVLLVEHKSLGKDLAAAKTQAIEYFPGLKEEELPKYILVSDFRHFELFDLEADNVFKFTLEDLPKHIELFGFIAGYERKEYKDFEQANIEASELMGRLYDELKTGGYPAHDLELFLVRLLFCLFADDTGIFERGILRQYVETNTKQDGTDLGDKLTLLFQVLNTPKNKRSANLDEQLAAFEYINGDLFAKTTYIPSFNSKMRELFLKACAFEWSKISPAIFGSLFQYVADKDKRRSFGEHYTTEKNILKTISPLFLEGLWEEFEKVKGNTHRLQEFHTKISKLKFLDPACGCGNFLVITYREIRKLEIAILKSLYRDGQLHLDISAMSKVDVDNFYGIEINEFPAKIAEVALWLMDHQMNMELGTAFGQYFARIPLKKTAKIVNGNALRLDWKEVVPPSELSYIFGNPPFVGFTYMEKTQKEDVSMVFSGLKNSGILDYVTCWYLKAAQYIQGTNISCAFVSTNSISQGEQVAVLWNELFNKYGIKINFAHRTFAWDSEAGGKAHVHVVIIGFATSDNDKKCLFEYTNTNGIPQKITAKNINPYLLEGQDIVVSSRNTAISNIPSMRKGSQPTDAGNLLFTTIEKETFVNTEPYSEKFFKHFISAKEFINGENRWCLWLKDAPPAELKLMPEVLIRLENIKNFRLASKKIPTQKQAATPSLFTEMRQPDSDYILVPSTSSERRKYIPMGFCSKDDIVANSCFAVPNATIYHFGVLTSEMHMIWTKYVCGRLKSDYRYSKDIVYNNFPWPKDVPEGKTKKVEEKAQAVLDTRASFPQCSLADLYNPITMPPALVKAHQELDKAVDACYGKTFATERERIEFLFNLYAQYTAPLIAASKAKKSKKSAK